MRMLFGLVRLEWKQSCMKKYLQGSAIILMGIFLAVWIMDLGDVLEGIASPMWLTDMCFMVYAGVLFSIFVIDGCRGSAAERTFAYPIRRRDLVLAKVASVWFAMVIMWSFGKLLICAVFFCRVTPDDIRTGFGKVFMLEIVLDTISLLNSCLGPLLVGMSMDSSKAGIACTVFLTVLIQKVAIAGSPVVHFYICVISVGIAAGLLLILVKLIEKRDI